MIPADDARSWRVRGGPAATIVLMLTMVVAGLAGGMLLSSRGTGQTAPPAVSVLNPSAPPSEPAPDSIGWPAPDSSGWPETDALQRAMEALAGTGATDCGRAKLYKADEIQAVDACLRAAIDSGRPFTARYDYQGIDSLPSLGIVRTRAAQVFMLNYDSAPGGNGFDEGAERFWVKECHGPKFVGRPVILDCVPTPTPVRTRASR